MKRLTSLVLVLAMIFTAMLGVVSFAEAETPAEPKELVVSSASLEFGTAVYLYIAVNYSEIGSAAGVTLQITNNKTGEVVVLDPATDISAPADSVAFKYDTIGAKNMGDELTLQALKDGVPSGESKIYSILEYALVAQGQGDEKLSNLMVAMLAYGANAQKVMNHEGTYDLAKTWGYISVVGSNEGKMIAEAGQPAPFTPDTSKTGANAALYNLATLEKFEGDFIVPTGSHKLIYLGDAQLTHVNLAMTSTDSSLNGSFTNTGSANVNQYVYMSESDPLSLTKLSGTEGTNFASMYMQQYFPGNSAANTGTASMSVVGGPDGYIKIGSSGKQSYVWWASPSCKTIAKAAAATAGNKFTLALTIGMDGTTSMPSGVMRVRGSSTHGNFFKTTTNGTTKVTSLIASTNGTTTKDVTIWTIQGEEGKQKFATVYIVFDLNNGDLSYYTEDGAYATTINGSTIIGAMSANAALIDWTQASSSNTTALIRNIKVFAGNIFE